MPMPVYSSMQPFLLASAYETILDFFSKGGWFMLPLVVCSLVAVTVSLFKFFSLRREVVLPKVVEGEIERLQPGDRPESLRQMVNQDPAALSVLANVALSHMHVSRIENSEAVQTRARREIMRLEGGLAVLETIVGISPLLGLLGAVSGLVHLFSNFGGAGKTSAQSNLEVASGIAEALNTTIVGLAIAIPTLILYTYFSKKVEAMAVELESLLADLLSKCYHKRSARPPAPTAVPTEDESDETAAGPLSVASSASYAPRARRLTSAPTPQVTDEPDGGYEQA
jgi:biopolymer transport protein ExbB